MPLGTTEQIVYDYLTNNVAIREFWMKRISDIRAEGKDDDALVDELVDRMAQVYWTSEEGWADIEGLVDRIDLMTADYKSVAYMLIGRDIENEVRTLFEAPPETTKPIRSKGTKESPIPITSSNYLAVAMHARTEIDYIFGKDKWRELSNYGDIHGLRCWDIVLADGTQESVWFDYSPSAELAARREAGEKVGILDALTPQQRQDFRKAIAIAEAETLDNQRIRKELKEGPPKEDDTTGLSMSLGCVAMIIVVYGIYLVVVTDNMLYRGGIVAVGFILMVVFGAISEAIEKNAKKKRGPRLTAMERLELKVDKAFAEYKRLNPDGSLSRDFIRQEWLKRHGFTDAIAKEV